MSTDSTSRRTFLGAAAAAGALAGLPAVHAAGGDILRVGLVGCGDRGTGAAAQAMAADPGARLVAMADAFADRIESSLETLRNNEAVAAKLDVPPARRFVGFDAYRAADGERRRRGPALHAAALPADPPPRRGRGRQARLRREAGRRRRARRALGARDLPARRGRRGSRSSPASASATTAASARRSAASTTARSATSLTLFANDYRGGRWAKPRQPGWTEMTYQMRNWYNFTWLSGDFNVEQHVHFLDVCAWAMKESTRSGPSAWAAGRSSPARSTATSTTTSRWSTSTPTAPGSSATAGSSRGCKNDMSVQVIGSRGRAELSERREGLRIRSPRGDWTFDGPANQMYQTEHDELFAAHPRRQADQQRRIHGKEHAAGDHGPDGRLHRPGGHLGDGR